MRKKKAQVRPGISEEVSVKIPKWMEKCGSRTIS